MGVDWRLYAARVIVALDPPAGVDPVSWAERIASRLGGVAAGVKIGLPLLLRAGYEAAARLLDGIEGLRVADLKLADIAPVMESIVEPLLPHVDAVIAHAFVGGRGALTELRGLLERFDVRLVLVYHMSHPGASSTFGRCIDVIDEVVESVRPWGLVAPATMPDVVRRARSRYPDVVVMSPGVGAQGAEPGEAICAGADYEIIGRSVTRAEDPLEALRRLSERGAEKLEACRHSLSL